MEMKTAVIYARYSCDNQSEQSIEGQLHVCEDYAKRNEILILDTYIDRAMTGTNDNRPSFQRMLKDSGKREWDYVLVYKLDRFSRNKYETAIHKKTLRDNGVKVVSAMENIPDTPEGIILESLLEGMNQYYSAELSQKVKRGMRETRKKGFYQGGRLPYGYKLDGRKIIPDETRAEVVRYIYDQFSKGVYVREIIETLTSRGIMYNGKPFALKTVYNILGNTKYSGVYTIGDEIIDNMFPPIIPADLYSKVRDLIEKNRYGKRSTESDFLLRFKIRCGYCGKPVSSSTGITRYGKTFRYYKCDSRKTNKNNCKLTSVQKDYLENLIIDTIVAKMSEPHIMDRLVAEVMAAQNENAESNAALMMLKKEKVGVDKSLENLVKAIENGMATKTTHKRLLELEQQQEELERQILIEQNRETLKLTEKEIRAYYADALRMDPKMLISCLVKKIVLYNDRIEIIYNSPLRNSPDDSRGCLLYRGFSAVKKGNEYQQLLEHKTILLSIYI